MREAIRRLQKLGEVTAVSCFYETEPVEVPSQQPWFLNCALALETVLMPQQLLSRTLTLEHEMGRIRTGLRGPRVIDIDLVLFGNAVVDTPELTIPHPAMERRRFVLAPLVEIAPEALHPILKRTIRELLAELPPNAGALRKYEESG